MFSSFLGELSSSVLQSQYIQKLYVKTKKGIVAHENEPQAEDDSA